MTPDEEPEPWIFRLPDAVFFLQEVLARQERLQLDFSPGSLAGLERYLARFETPAEFRDFEDAEWIVEGAAGYVGETLLRLAGGGWAEQERPELFVVPPIHADPALGLEPVNPLDLVDAATLGGDPLRRQYAAWAEVVAAHRAAHPGWSPGKERTPVLDPMVYTADEREHLAKWLVEWERAFPAWARRYGTGVDWDFSRASVEALGRLVLAADPADDGFRDGAGWYAGEAMRRAHGGVWLYRRGDPEQSDYLGRPYLEERPDGGRHTLPFLAIRLIAEERDPGILVEDYDAWVV
ncbi:hypothetical protein [Nocardia sp. NPDC004260]